jgi:pectate lyase-like protein
LGWARTPARGAVSESGVALASPSATIVQNLIVDAASSGVDGDGIQVHYAHHVWIDHCEIRDALDGLVDIVHGSDFVTLSHNRFLYTAAAAPQATRRAQLVGHSTENGAEDRGRLNVTFHHNWWGVGVDDAVFGRFGQLHLYDNYFASPANERVLTAGLQSSWLLENNYFGRVRNPHAISPSSGARLLGSGNVYDQTSGAQDTTASAFVPPYVYALSPAADLPARIVAEAGPPMSVPKQNAAAASTWQIREGLSVCHRVRVVTREYPSSAANHERLPVTALDDCPRAPSSRLDWCRPRGTPVRSQAASRCPLYDSEGTPIMPRFFCLEPLSPSRMVTS